MVRAIAGASVLLRASASWRRPENAASASTEDLLENLRLQRSPLMGKSRWVVDWVGGAAAAQKAARFDFLYLSNRRLRNLFSCALNVVVDAALHTVLSSVLIDNDDTGCSRRVW